MFKAIQPRIFLFCSGLLIVAVWVWAAYFHFDFFIEKTTYFAGAQLHIIQPEQGKSTPVFNQIDPSLNERFHRPSKKEAFPNPYTFSQFQSDTKKITTHFQRPEEVLLAYYGILREAANMLGYSGGCGTIGDHTTPYSYAYQLLENQISFKQYQKSFQGIGHMTLLNVIEAYSPPTTPKTIKYYMVEVEYITGPRAKTDKEYHKGSYFGYLYGVVTVENTKDGWKIKNIEYTPEDFLCAPYHSWYYMADSVVDIVYKENLQMIDTIDKVETKNELTNIFATGENTKYLFTFVRLTNGYDVLLNEYVQINGTYQTTNLLPEKWSYLKISGK